MKKFIGIALMCASVIATAGEPSKIEGCKSMAELSRSIMQARQNGVEVSVAVDKTMEVEPKFVGLVIAIYSTPMYSTANYQQKAIKQAYNDSFVGCMRE